MQFDKKIQDVSSSQPPHFPPRQIYILGAGHFGRVASQRLSRRYAEASILVIDSSTENLSRIEEEFSLPVVHAEAVSYLCSNRFSEDQWIIPAIPVHVAFQWLMYQLKSVHTVNQMGVPQAVDKKVPHPFRMNSKTLYASYATFKCPDACNEPDEICTYTGEPRQGNLFDDLARVEVPGFAIVVVRSWQLAPGVGGYPGSSLTGALEAIQCTPGNYLIATSCRCHGVIDALGWSDSN